MILLKSLPKVELHRHLDGSVRESTASEILGVDVSNKMQVNNCKSLSDYLSKFEIPLIVMQSKENLERISYELAVDLKKDNVIYAEIRFCPILHTKNGLSLEEVIDSVLKGLKKVEIKTNLILCMMRNFEEDENKKIIYLAKKYLNKGVVGIDLAGDESKYKTQNYEHLFDLVKQNNIPFTIHAGEADDYNSVLSAIKFGAKRIGHGVKSVDSIEAIQKIINENVTLEVCPTSNVDTCIVNVYKNHPIKKLYDLGVKITVNTDNNTVSNIDLTGEYEKLLLTFNFTEKDFLNFNMNAIDSAFLTNEEKEELKKIVINSYNCKENI